MSEEIKNYYENYDEDGRLFRDNTHKVEYLTTIRYFNRLFSPNSRILDVCAGTGRYALYLAENGHSVTACDLVPHNVSIIKSAEKAHMLDDIRVGNAMDLSAYDDNSFDAVLCMGALYHLREDAERKQAVSECVRVCKSGGLVALAYITDIGSFYAQIDEHAANIDELVRVANNSHETVFIVITPSEIEELTAQCGLEKVYNIAADGLARLVQDKLNRASDADFNKYMEYHYSVCESEHAVGASLHGLWIGRKRA